MLANADLILGAALKVDKGTLDSCCLIGNLTNVLAAVGAFDGKYEGVAVPRMSVTVLTIYTTLNPVADPPQTVTVPEAGMVRVAELEIERLPLHPVLPPLNEPPCVS